jgi:hypothetical protein
MRSHNRKYFQRSVLLFVFALGTVASAQTGPPYTITTFSGGGPNDINALNGAIGLSAGVALDGMGNILVGDEDYARVFKVTPSGTITVFAGNGIEGNTGDGGLATDAELTFPVGVFVDAAGNVFIADEYASVIREVSASTGIISTVAGNGTSGYSGDGGLATNAELNGPRHVFVDSTGDIFIADTFNNVVRKVAAGTGIITTVAGNGTAGYSGDNGPATQAELNYTTGLYVDSAGNLFITDTNNSVIRKVTAATGFITTIAGNGTAGYSGDGGPAMQAKLDVPEGLFVDGSGNLFIADTNNCVVREVSASSSFISTVAGTGACGYTGDGGLATQAEFFLPFDLTSDAAGDLFVADSLNHVIREVNSGSIVSTIAGNGKQNISGDGGVATQAELYLPWGVAADTGGNLFIADSGNNVIREVIATTNIISTVAGNGGYGYAGDGGPALSATFASPAGVATDSTGNLFIVDNQNDVIRKVAAGTAIITTVAGNGTAGYSGDGGLATQAQLNLPYGAAVDLAGNVFIADTSNHRIRKLTASTGVITTVAGDGVSGYSGDGGLATQATLTLPHGIFVDSSGNLFIADSGNNAVRKVTASTGVITTVAGNGTAGYSGDGGSATQANLNFPTSAFVDAAGNLIIADSINKVIRAVSASSGNISTVAGNGTAGYAGDGGPATLGEFASPQGLAFDSAGHVFVADSTSERVRELTPTVTPLTVTTANLPAGAVGTGYSQTLQAAGGTAPYTWSMATGNLPGGLSLTAATGVISGTPTTAGTSSFTVKVTDAKGLSATATLGILVVSQLTVTTTSLPIGVTGTTYSQALQATGGAAPYTWSIASGNLPGGLSLTPGTGVISGTPTTAGTSNFTVKVSDANGTTATSGTLSIAVESPLSVTTTSLLAGAVGTAYSQTLQAAGGATPYTWSIASGNLPGGLSLTAGTGVISGTPTTVGTASFTVQVTDANTLTATKPLSILIVLPVVVTITTLPGGTIGSVYAQTTLSASGGTGPYSWTLAAGSLRPPPGLTVSSIGALSGTPAVAGTFIFSVVVADANGLTATSNPLSVAVTAPPSAPTCTPPTVQINGTEPLSVHVASNCTDPTTIANTTIDWGDGTAPSSGTAADHPYASGGSYSITVTATNSAGLSNTVSVNVTVTASLTASVPQGQAAQGSASATAPLGVPTTQVSYQCTKANGPSGEQTLAFYHLACNINGQGASATVTLTSTPTPVNISVQTNSSAMARMQEDMAVKNRTELTYAAFWLLPGLMMLTGASSRGRTGRSRMSRTRYARLLVLGLMMCSMLACGGGGATSPPPQQAVTPAGTYTVTGTGTSTSGGGTTSTVTIGFSVTIG